MEKKRITVFTSGRWDYGHLYWVMKGIEASKKLELLTLFPGNHPRTEELLKIGTTQMLPHITDIKTYGSIHTFTSSIFEVYKPDIFLCLGDRWETHAAATAALLLNVPIAHIHGGETTEGAFDDNLRNSITMMSDYHFTAHEEYANNAAQMIGLCTTRFGKCEQLVNRSNSLFKNKLWNKVFLTGAPGLDWFTKTKLYTRDELMSKIDIDFREPYIIACFNPVTKELEHIEGYIYSFMEALVRNKQQTILIEPNIDPKNGIIREMYKEIDARMPLIHCYKDIDHLTYLSLMLYASFMVGNSSSGIIEAASVNLPVVDIGTRQQGRIKPDNVINVGYSIEEILAGIEQAENYKGKCVNPYGDGHSSEKIIKVLEETE